MAATVIIEDSQIPSSPEPPKTDGNNEKQIEMTMAAQFGAMTESNRQLQEKLNRLEAEYERAVSAGTSSQAEIRRLEQRIDDLIAKLEEPDTTTDEPTPGRPPSPPAPITQTPKKTKRGILDILING